ncbi:MAG: AEC family transporter [Desulfocapsaceae bacterium]|nr:AEC family transporter [Desulfocapsaceae bacterium]
MENFILTISFLLIGMGLRRLPRFPKETAQVLNLFVIHISLPALILLKVPQLTFSRDILAPVIMPWAMLAVSAAIILLAARLRNWGREITGALLLLIPLGNTSFLGIPMVRAFFDEAGIPYAVLYDQLGSFLALATYGTVVLALYGSGEKPRLTLIATKVITFPPFLALILALALIGCRIALPAPVIALFTSLAATLVPVVMIAVGYQLTLRLRPEVMSPLLLGLSVKLIVAPLLALLFCHLLGLSSLAVRVSIFEAGMPPMVSAGALAIMAGLSPELTAAMVGGGILLSFLTLPLLFQLI